MLKTIPNNIDQIYGTALSPELNFSNNWPSIGNYHEPHLLFYFAKKLLHRVYHEIKINGYAEIYGIKLDSIDFNSQ